ncbi:hypothetical protein IW147_005518 [Coemansia sp. RSA 720]|nr:hypothetical protein LPJ76_003342 [Coemansia sp. RSA 638]KAJ2119877.1 hypothetical protein IW147_005518 [Coemansia sp. RSA 720]
MPSAVPLHYNITLATLVALTAVNAVMGAGIAALGTHMLATSVPGFSSTASPIYLIIFGILATYISGLATTGVISTSWKHMQVVGLGGMLLAILELLLILTVAQAPIRAQSGLRNAWMRAYNTNKLSLQRVEHLFGCCGFQDATDMPSHTSCSKSLNLSIVNGCHEYLTHAVYHQSSVTARWATLAVLVQVISLIAGSYLIARVFEVATTWLDEPDDVPSNTGPPEPIVSAPNVLVMPSIPAAPNGNATQNDAHETHNEAAVTEAVLAAVSDTQPTEASAAEGAPALSGH